MGKGAVGQPQFGHRKGGLSGAWRAEASEAGRTAGAGAAPCGGGGGRLAGAAARPNRAEAAQGSPTGRRRASRAEGLAESGPLGGRRGPVALGRQSPDVGAHGRVLDGLEVAQETGGVCDGQPGGGGGVPARCRRRSARALAAAWRVSAWSTFVAMAMAFWECHVGAVPASRAASRAASGVFIQVTQAGLSFIQAAVSCCWKPKARVGLLKPGGLFAGTRGGAAARGEPGAGRPGSNRARS